MSEFSIRKTYDFFSIVALNQEIFPGDLLDVSTNVHGWIVRCGDDRKPIGFCTCTDIGHRILFLSRAGLLPNYFGYGLHKRLINIRLRYAKVNGFKTVITYVKKDNYASFANLIKCGFLIYTPEYDYAGKDFIYLIKYF